MMEFKQTANIAELRTLWQEAFEDNDDYLDLFFSTAYSEKRSMAAFIGDELAGALYWFDCELENKKTAYIYAVATAKCHRSKGVCAALMAHTHLFLKENGYSLAILVPSEASLFTFYGKIGYKTCGFINELKPQNCAGNAQTSKVSPEEYFSLRRNFTPQASVNLIGYYEFLDCLFDFYKGENFIFCKAKDGFFLPEFLGNNKSLASIIASLGGKSAIIRTFGNDRPFCMGISLNGTPINEKIYFPFSFD